MVTDGEQTKGDKSVESVNEMLANAAKPLKDKGVKIISLGIGKKVNKENLEAISSGDFVFRASSFNSLRRMVSDLRKGTCLGKKRLLSLALERTQHWVWPDSGQGHL